MTADSPFYQPGETRRFLVNFQWESSKIKNLRRQERLAVQGLLREKESCDHARKKLRERRLMWWDMLLVAETLIVIKLE